MAKVVEDIGTLKINLLSQAQYDAEVQAGTVEPNELYLTPSSGSGVSDVEVDGESVVTGGVAQIDLTGKSDIGHTHTKSAITDFPTIPSKTSDLTNDSGFITGYTETDPVFSASAAHGISSSDITSWNGKYAKPSGGIPKTDLASAVQTSLGKADSALQSYTETDPTVPSWAKASSKPSYTASEVGAVPTSRKVNGKALSSDITLSASDVSALPSSTSIPSKTSDLTNDSGFITGYTETDPIFSASAAHGITSTDISNWNGKSDFSGDYDDLTNKPTLPSVYVTEEGESSGWHYRKWSTGKVEAWVGLSYASASWSSWVSPVKCMDKTFTIPSGIFESAPLVMALSQSNQYWVVDANTSSATSGNMRIGTVASSAMATYVTVYAWTN